jgi:membrane protease YdiL (CAAX protease family)
MLILAEEAADAAPLIESLSPGPDWLPWFDYLLLAAGGVAILWFIIARTGLSPAQWFRNREEGSPSLLPEDGLLGLLIYFGFWYLGDWVVKLTLGSDASKAEVIGAHGLVSMATGVVLLVYLASLSGMSFTRWLRPQISGLQFGVWSIGGALGALATAQFFVWVTMQIAVLVVDGAEFPMHQTLAALVDPSQPKWVRLLLVVSPIVGAPIMEEALFRGLIQRSAARAFMSRWAGILVAAMLFGLVHYSVGWYVVPAMVALGILLGVIYECTGSLLVVMVVHGLFNLKNVIWTTLMA